MKKNIFFLFIMLAAVDSSFSTTHTIINSGFSFSPNSITINSGDTVIFSLAAIHTAREVDSATWAANEATSNGGFDLPEGGGTIVLTQAGVHYYVCVPHASMGMKGSITVNSATEIRSGIETTPDNFILMQNYPNPFNPSTTIRYALPLSSHVSLKIYNVLGQKVEELLNTEQQAGWHEITWNAKISSGLYYYRMDVVSTSNPNQKFTQIKKMMLLK